MSVRRGVRSGAVPVLTWAGLTVTVVALTYLSNRVTRDDRDWSQWRGPEFIIDGLLQYDGHSYLQIANDGYAYRAGTRSSIAWFPLYPLLVRAVGNVLHPPVVAGFTVTAVSSVVALVLYWHWLGRHEFIGAARLTAFAALAVYPYSWFLYGAVYADATFMACAIGAVLLVERDRPVLAGLVGALATACRPTGMALVPALVALAAARDGVLGPSVARSLPADGRVREAVRRVASWLQWPGSIDRTRLRWQTAAPLLSLAGIGAYAAYLWSRFGSPIIFLTNQETFHGRYPFLKLTFASRLVHARETPVLSATVTLQALLALGILATAGAVARRLGFAYAVLVVAAVAIPVISTHDFMGTGRYLLLAFPALAVVGEQLARRPAVARAVVGASTLLMLTMAFGFGRSSYLS